MPSFEAAPYYATEAAISIFFSFILTLVTLAQLLHFPLPEWLCGCTCTWMEFLEKKPDHVPTCRECCSCCYGEEEQPLLGSDEPPPVFTKHSSRQNVLAPRSPVPSRTRPITPTLAASSVPPPASPSPPPVADSPSPSPSPSPPPAATTTVATSSSSSSSSEDVDGQPAASELETHDTSVLIDEPEQKERDRAQTQAAAPASSSSSSSHLQPPTASDDRSRSASAATVSYGTSTKASTRTTTSAATRHTKERPKDGKYHRHTSESSLPTRMRIQAFICVLSVCGTLVNVFVLAKWVGDPDHTRIWDMLNWIATTLTSFGAEAFWFYYCFLIWETAYNTEHWETMSVNQKSFGILGVKIICFILCIALCALNCLSEILCVTDDNASWRFLAYLSYVLAVLLTAAPLSYAMGVLWFRSKSVKSTHATNESIEERSLCSSPSHSPSSSFLSFSFSAAPLSYAMGVLWFRLKSMIEVKSVKSTHATNEAEINRREIAVLFVVTLVLLVVFAPLCIVKIEQLYNTQHQCYPTREEIENMSYTVRPVGPIFFIGFVLLSWKYAILPKSL